MGCGVWGVGQGWSVLLTTVSEAGPLLAQLYSLGLSSDKWEYQGRGGLFPFAEAFCRARTVGAVHV